MTSITRVLTTGVAVAFLCGLAALPAVKAQEPSPDEIPEELVLSLLGDFDRARGGDVLVGRRPEWFPSDLILPADARVLGARVRDTTYAEVVVATAQSPEEVVENYERTLSGRGWVVRGRSEKEEGLVTTRSLRSARLCREDASLSISPKGPSDTGARFRLSYEKTLPEKHVCNREDRRREGEMWRNLPDISIPSIRPPDGITTDDSVDGSTTGSPENRWRMEGIRVRSSLSAVEVAARYGEQLRAQGWTLQQKRAVEGHAAWSWRLTDGSGERWNGLFTVVSLQGVSEWDYRLRFEVWGPDTSD